MAQQIRDIENVIEGLGSLGYVADRALATAVYLLLKLEKPLLIEGHAGVGKTEAAKALAAMLETELIRLQCYEGLDLNSAVYEWNYQTQLLAIKIQEGSDKTVEEKENYVFGPGFLLKRPLLQSILYEERAPVLLVDEIDRVDEAFEAFLLELLAEFQITIPELGTIRAKRVPHVILTSNSSRESPGVAETLDLSRSLILLGKTTLDREAAEETLGCILKSADDLAKVRSQGLAKLLSRSRG